MKSLVLRNCLTYRENKMNDKLIDALIKAQQEIDHVVQDASNPFFKSDYASLKEVFDSVKQHLNNNGIYVQQISHENENGATIETVFYGHGDKMSSGKVSIPVAKHDPQAFGSALSYAKRYSLLMACGVATKKEDDDAEAAMRRNANKSVPKTKKKTPKGEFKIVGKNDNDILEACDDIETYLINCRNYFGDPTSKDCQDSFANNKWHVKAAYASASGDTKESFEKLMNAYNEPINSEN
tara:strand:- start:247 stop:963 length:717 start_codon:yes stop_codon:yes gene_type:complete